PLDLALDIAVHPEPTSSTSSNSPPGHPEPHFLISLSIIIPLLLFPFTVISFPSPTYSSPIHPIPFPMLPHNTATSFSSPLSP
ncbi:hypothetical protein, partial [Kocuria rhizophila]|uniref:hypothetical protein n=1 Tax=Kocuria rhizophila TaxID=72000 RepID=UPI001C931259